MAGMLSRLLGFSKSRAEQPKAVVTLEATKGFNLDVVGESKFQTALSKIAGGRSRDGYRIEVKAMLQPEPENPYDADAVKVSIQGVQVGYLPREKAAVYSRKLRDAGLHGSAAGCRAMILGGWATNQHDIGHFGVKLAVKWPPRFLQGLQ